jgi:outer membrane protein assembly factor BamB
MYLNLTRQFKLINPIETMMKKNLQFLLMNVLIFCLSAYSFSCTNNRAGSATPEESGSVTKDTARTEISFSDSQNRQEWPSFHGTDRSNKSAETGLLTTWPEGGPELVYTVSGLGEGYSSVSIADGMIFTSGTYDNQAYVFAYDLNGKLLWKKANGAAWKVEVSWARGYDGPRSTPTFDNGVVYHVSELNKLTAYNAKTGDIVWTRNLKDDFEAEMPDYGFTESVLIDGDKLFVKTAGKKGYQVCLNKTSGETIWINKDISGAYGYNSSILHNYGGYRQLISESSAGFYGVDSETGKLLWSVDFPNMHDLKCSDPIAFDDYVFMTTGLGGGSKLIQLKANGDKINAEAVWKTDLMDNYHGGVIYHNGYFYGSGDRNRGWFAIDMKTGKQMWKSPGSMGSLTYADNMLYLLDEKGTMRLVKAEPESFVVAGEFKVPKGGTVPFWSHPVVCGGRLYLRHSDKLFVYDIRQK